LGVRVFLRGGLGNQLFQYAFALDLAQILETSLILDAALLPKRNDVFRGVSRWAEQISTFEHSGFLETRRFQPHQRTSTFSKFLTAELNFLNHLNPKLALSLGIVTDVTVDQFLRENQTGKELKRELKLHGYFQREELFAEKLWEVSNQLKIISRPGAEYLDAMAHLEKETVALHIRLGDKAKLSDSYQSDLYQRLGYALRKPELSGREVTIFTDSPELIDPKKLGIPVRNLMNSTNLRPIEVLNLFASHDFIVGSDSTFFWWVTRVQKVSNPIAYSIQY
jgi:hypothetical protein